MMITGFYTTHLLMYATPCKWSYQFPSFAIFRKLQRVIFGGWTEPAFFFLIFVGFIGSVSDSVSVTDTKS